jgi:hypothetical protein
MLRRARALHTHHFSLLFPLQSTDTFYIVHHPCSSRQSIVEEKEWCGITSSLVLYTIIAFSTPCPIAFHGWVTQITVASLHDPSAHPLALACNARRY